MNRGARVEKKCKRCGDVFMPRVADVKRGWGKYCSKSCKAAYQTYVIYPHVSHRHSIDDDQGWDAHKMGSD